VRKFFNRLTSIVKDGLLPTLFFGGPMILKSWVLLLVSFSVVTVLHAQEDKEHFNIKEVVTKEIPALPDQFEEKRKRNNGDPNPDIPYIDPMERVGRVITVARDIVALGEDIYRLAIKGKPTNSTSYAPISVVPKENGEAVDVLDVEYWFPPVKRSYSMVYKNGYGMEVVQFKYSVIYSYGGSFRGRGMYLTGVQIIPESVRTAFGFDFEATMKLGGIQNQGSKYSPVAGATILMEYSVSSLVRTLLNVDSFFISGDGRFKKF
jgi:hypothetical protein